MANSYIGCGKLSSLFLYILYRIIFKFLKDILLSFGLVKNDINYGLFFFETELNKHIIIKSIYKYISFILFGTIFLYISSKSNNNKNEESKESKESRKSIYLIYLQKTKISKTSKFNLVLICFLYVYFLEFVEISYSVGFHDFDLWIFNIVFALFFISCYFSIEIYNHQKYSLLFIFFTNLFLIILGSFFSKGNNAYDTTSRLFTYKLISIVIYIIYIINSYLISFSRVLGKVLMELKYISPYLIIIIIGIIGLTLTSISICVLGNFKCINNDKLDICNIYDKTTNITYYDSITIYFSNLNDKKNNDKTEFWLEVIIINPLNLIFTFMEFNYEILIIYYLNPIYFLISDSLYYGTLNLLAFIINYEDIDVKKMLNVLADCFGFIGYLIYVEIIELKFLGLDKNLRKTISQRGSLDLINVKNRDTENFSEDSQEEEKEVQEDEENDEKEDKN